MKSQYTRKAKPEPANTTTAIEPKTNSKLAGPKSRSTTVVVKRRNRRNRINGAAEGSTGGNSDGGKSRAGFCGGGISRGNNSEGGYTGGCNGNAGAGSSGAGNKSCQLVPVRRKPLSDYMMLEEQPFASSRPTTSSSHLSDQDPPMSYAAAVESLSVSRLRVKVVLSPRLKRSGNQPPIKRPSPKNSPDTKVKLIPPTQSKPHNVLNPKRNMAQVPPQSRVAQANPKPNNSLPPAGNNKKSKSKKSQKARQNQQRAEATSPELPVSPQPCDVTPQSCSPKFSDTTAYLDHYHEQMQRILAEQTAGQKPYPNRGQVKSCKHNAQLPTNRSLFDFDERLFKRGDLESAAILAQNQAMMRKWLNPSMLIS